MRIAAILASIALAVLVAACGSGDGGDNRGDVTATATADAFDPRIYAQFALLPADVPAGLLPDDTFAPGGTSYTTVYLDPATSQQLIQSTVTRMLDRVEREATFIRLRRIYTGFFLEGEENYNHPGVDQAFIYRLNSPPAMAVHILRGPFIMYIQINAYPGPPLKEDLDRYADLMISRVNKYIQDPSSVPIPDTDPLAPVAPGGATPAAPPAPTP